MLLAFRCGCCCCLGAPFLLRRRRRLPGGQRHRHHVPAHARSAVHDLQRGEGVGAERLARVGDFDRHVEQRHEGVADEDPLLLAADEDGDLAVAASPARRRGRAAAPAAARAVRSGSIAGRSGSLVAAAGVGAGARAASAAGAVTVEVVTGSLTAAGAAWSRQLGGERARQAPPARWSSPPHRCSAGRQSSGRRRRDRGVGRRYDRRRFGSGGARDPAARPAASVVAAAPGASVDDSGIGLRRAPPARRGRGPARSCRATDAALRGTSLVRGELIDRLRRRVEQLGVRNSCGVSSMRATTTRMPSLLTFQSRETKSVGMRMQPCEAAKPGRWPSCSAMPDQVRRCM